jgi:hypothetical protein
MEVKSPHIITAIVNLVLGCVGGVGAGVAFVV